MTPTQLQTIKAAEIYRGGIETRHVDAVQVAA